MTFLQSIGLYSTRRQVAAHRRRILALASRPDLSRLVPLLAARSAIGSAFGTLLFAYPLALFLRRRRFGARVIGSIVKVPLFVPALVAAFLIVNILAFNGLLNSALMYVGIIDRPLRMLNDKFGWNVLAIQIWKNLPFQLLIIASVLETIRTDIEDAARNLGANPLQVIWHIVLPLSIPGILIAVVLVFILTFGDYAITKVAGPVYPVLAVGADVHRGLHAAELGRSRLHRRGDHRHLAALRRDLCARGARHRRGRPMTASRSPMPARAADAGGRAFGSFIALLIIALLMVWTAVPLFMAVMWSLVNPDDPWSPPAVLPPSLSLAQWEYVFTYLRDRARRRHELHPRADRHDRVLHSRSADGLCARPLLVPRQGSAAHPDPAADRACRPWSSRCS